jgi:hypothetical protein
VGISCGHRRCCRKSAVGNMGSIEVREIKHEPSRPGQGAKQCGTERHEGISALAKRLCSRHQKGQRRRGNPWSGVGRPRGWTYRGHRSPWRDAAPPRCSGRGQRRLFVHLGWWWSRRGVAQRRVRRVESGAVNRTTSFRLWQLDWIGSIGSYSSLISRQDNRPLGSFSAASGDRHWDEDEEEDEEDYNRSHCLPRAIWTTEIRKNGNDEYRPPTGRDPRSGRTQTVWSLACRDQDQRTSQQRARHAD